MSLDGVDFTAREKIRAEALGILTEIAGKLTGKKITSRARVDSLGHTNYEAFIEEVYGRFDLRRRITDKELRNQSTFSGLAAYLAYSIGIEPQEDRDARMQARANEEAERLFAEGYS